jgi:hypothetical protein
VTGRAPEAGAGHSRTGGWLDIVATVVLAVAGEASTGARAVILGVGFAVLLGTIAWMATFPISLST